MKDKLILPLCALLSSLSLAQAAVITVNTIDNSSGPGDGLISLDEALRSATDGDSIQFNIPGAGPHVIATPIGGYPLITANNLTIDGYSQPGSAWNTNPILGGNNAQIKIVLDSTGNESVAGDPQDPSLNARRSTRILHSGYGDSENGILAVFAGDNFSVRGLSFIARRSAGGTDVRPSTPLRWSMLQRTRVCKGAGSGLRLEVLPWRISNRWLRRWPLSGIAPAVMCIRVV